MLSDLVIAYLFLGGCGGGCAFFCCILGMLSDKRSLSVEIQHRFKRAEGRLWSRFFTGGIIASVICLLLGSICLCADMGQLSKMLLVLFAPKASYLFFGAWSILGCLLICMILAFMWAGAIKSKVAILKILSALGAIMSLMVIVYTGLLLSSMAAVPIWNTFWTVVLFGLSALSCGIAILLVSSMASGSLFPFERVLGKLMKADMAIIAGECITLFLMLISVAHMADTSNFLDASSRAAIMSLDRMVFGDLAWVFWALLAGVGLVFPFILECALIYSSRRLSRVETTKRVQLMMTLSCLAVLIGGATLRYLFVAAAAHPIMLPFS